MKETYDNGDPWENGKDEWVKTQWGLQIVGEKTLENIQSMFYKQVHTWPDTLKYI